MSCRPSLMAKYTSQSDTTPGRVPTDETDGTVGRTGATCIGCGSAVELKYIRTEGRAGRMGSQLMTTVAEGNRARIYLEPTPEHVAAGKVPRLIAFRVATCRTIHAISRRRITA